jgi:hypothetical protein
VVELFRCEEGAKIPGPSSKIFGKVVVAVVGLVATVTLPAMT